MAISGKLIGGGIVGIGLIFGIGMWYAQTRGHYEPVEGLTEVSIAGEQFQGHWLSRPRRAENAT